MTIGARVYCGGCGKDLSSGRTVVRDAQGRSFCEACSRGDQTVTMAGATVPHAGSGTFPTNVGRYRVVRMIGEGGMGTVYEAVQDSPKRVVALKMIRAGLMDQRRLRRFLFEAEVLGRLQHPAIGMIYDAGTAETATGTQPYFAMEFVEGEKLTDYAKARGLSVRARLELLAMLADAVHYAHTKGVIHRDLKPGNILVVPPESGSASAVGQLKILDFGLARSTESDGTASLATESGAVMGTLAYMAPEQAAGKMDAIDTRADVYALGVIGYELLSGKMPLKVEGAGIYEAVRVIQEEEATRLSVHDRALRGDVEVIIGKAMEKDRDRRYASAAELAADIRRFLGNEPITARRASAMYQIGKFARRHKAVVSAVLGVAAALVLGIIGTSVGMMRAREAQHIAEEATARATAGAKGAQLRWYDATVARGDALVLAGQFDEARKAYDEAWLPCNKLPVSPLPLELGIWECDRKEKGEPARQLRLEGPIVNVRFSGEKILAETRDGRVWNAKTAAPQTNTDTQRQMADVVMNGDVFRFDGRAFFGHKGKVRTVFVSEDGKWAVSGGEDKTVRLWEVATGRLLHTFAGHEAAVGAVAIRGDVIVSGDDAGTVRVWDFSGRKKIGND